MVWAAHHANQWPDLDVWEEPADGGRRLDVGGFVFSDPPEEIFRGISATYLRDAWHWLGDVLVRHEITSDDLAWGMMHPGETVVTGVRPDDPCRFIGWTSRDLDTFDTNTSWRLVDDELGRGSPPLRCAVTGRSLRWRIGGDDTVLGLRLFEALATDEYTDWNPQVVLSAARDESEPWVRIAVAIRENDQASLDRALAAAERTYSGTGFRIVVRGYQAYAAGWGLGLRFPCPPK